MTPTLHLTNWASRKLHRGRKWTIMARPREWEMGVGSVDDFVPPLETFEDYKSGLISLREYRVDVADAWMHGHFEPGRLLAQPYDDPPVEVAHNDTLLCCCSKKDAAEGKCHRVWAGELLRKAGWEVILDGRPLKGVDEEWRPIWKT